MGRPKTIETSELLAIARDVFRKNGPTATTRDVAKAAGISQAVLYQRFKTKDALFIASLTIHAPDLNALSEIDATRHDPRSYLALFAARAKDHFRKIMPSLLSHAAHPKYGKEMMGQIHRHNRAGEIAAMLVLRLRTWMQAGLIRPLEPRVFAHAFIHALHSMAMVELLSGDDEFYVTDAKEMAAFVDLFWQGLQPPSPARKNRGDNSTSGKGRK
jgi:AcrR family transcriptional regulator